VFRTSLADLLRDDGHELLDYEHPGAVPPLADLYGIALLVTDYAMPQRNGFELADEFRKAHPDAPVILVSGLASIDARGRHFVHPLEKPVDYDTLHGLIHRLVA
jgi:DNA-binding NtrC family response regulator